MKILLAGPMSRWNATDGRRRALIELGHEVTALDVRSFLSDAGRIRTKLRWHILAGTGIRRYNRALIEAAETIKPDIVWIELPIQVHRRTVDELRRRAGLTLSHNAEYLGFRRYQYRHFFPAIPSYDVHVVTNDLTAEILPRMGARRVILTEFGYDPELHHPLPSTKQEAFASDAVLVGHYEPAYARMVRALRDAGIGVAVYGPGWGRAFGLADRRGIKPIYGDDYIRALSASRLCLGFVSVWNRSQATHRTFEIPAVGGFLLGPRTRQHLSYYVEGQEAEYFASDKDLVEKARFYLDHDDARRRIAAAGHRRCLTSGYGIKDVTSRLIKELSVRS
jgi:spore maturation protein CgeB